MQCSIWSFLPSVSCTWRCKCSVLSGLFYLLSHVAGDVNAVFYLVFLPPVSYSWSSKCCVLCGLFYLLSHVAGAVNAVFYLVFSTSCLM